MAQIITQQWGGGWGWWGWSYTPWNWINIENNEISVDESVVQTTDNLVTNLTNPDDTHYPSAKAVSDALSCAWAWDMMKSVYDPNNVNANAFDYDNFINTPTIPTDNCQLANGCWYAKTCDIPTDNCQLANWCGYTTCIWTLTASNIGNTAYGSSWSGVTTVAPSKNAVYAKVSSIDAVIPSAATSSNQLADKNYVNDSINSVTAYYITKNAAGDQFATRSELINAGTYYSWWVVRVPTRNDYAIVLDDETHNDEVTRYIYNNGWEYQYTINESPLTQAQINALNSWITSAKVWQYDTAVTTMWWYGDIVTHNASEFATSAQWAKADTALQPWDNISELNNDAGYLTTAPVTSVNWQTWAVTVEEWITKIFTLASTSDLTNAQAAYDWWTNWGNPIVKISGAYMVYHLFFAADTTAYFTRAYNYWNATSTLISFETLRFTISNGSVTAVAQLKNNINKSTTVPTTNDWTITFVV